MRLSEALKINGKPAGDADRTLQIDLVCGFTPLHLATFLQAYAQLRWPDYRAAVQTGLFGDLEGNIERASGRDGVLAIVEWSDLDQRLGYRASAGWGAAVLDDVLMQVEDSCRELESRLSKLGERVPVAVVPPTLALPPVSYLPVAHLGAWEGRLRLLLAQFEERLTRRAGIRLVSDTQLALRSPHAQRHDIKLDLRAGFPYTIQHAEALAALGIECLFPAAPKKGLITDLDDTLWKGILGDAGVDGVSWSLENHAQEYGLYQQLLSSLADSGILIAAASKNDPAPVLEVLQRADILLNASQIFPVHAGWGAKSQAVERILETWNIAPDAVVFVDDNRMELAEVAEKFPVMECLRFPAGDTQSALDLLWKLRSLFGKTELLEEDRLRATSVRTSKAMLDVRAAEGGSPEFVRRLDAKVALRFLSESGDKRAFELVNKTNQFNLNGRRYTEAEWREFFKRPGAFLVLVNYEDRFGPLGNIAVLAGENGGDAALIESFVLSCRAFSRQVEYQIIRQLFDRTGFSKLEFSFLPTGRNGPLIEFFSGLLGVQPGPGSFELPLCAFDKTCPPLNHKVEIYG